MIHTQRIPPTTEELDEYVTEILKFADLDPFQRAEVDPDPRLWRLFGRSSTSTIPAKGLTFEKALSLVRKRWPGPKLFIHENMVRLSLERLEGSGKTRRAKGMAFNVEVPVWRWNGGDIPAEAQDTQATTKIATAEPKGEGQRTVDDGGKQDTPSDPGRQAQATGVPKRAHKRDSGNRIKKDAKRALVRYHLDELGAWNGTLKELRKSLKDDRGLEISESTLSRYLRGTKYARRGNPHRAVKVPGKRTDEREAAVDDGVADMSGCDAWTMPDDPDA